ncbi:hypothetical protein MFMK1_001157 [Metallumcola ferriviriculae]|uniref:Double-GTPase 1 domain-containing protein n=1 Tax=Metallumcola ferriviriculae TaxID=3039180 RepID=A0AAU0UNC2_9FIRM|nr:hypothetical protein MFMK1_001157 [Desulfitibacteraceae bacterium MK1]
MDGKKCFIMGLPEAGKTTYLAALWHCLNNKENLSLRIKTYTEDHSYLSGISAKWADAEEVSRTKPEFEKKAITLSLENNKEDEITLAFTDLSGESFQHQYENREAKKEHVEFVQDCLGICLFVHPEKIKEPYFISEVPASVREENIEGAIEHEPRNPRENDPTQVQLVDLLQFITHMRGNKSVNLCIMISAWDLLKETCQKEMGPENYIKTRMPLLWQYLKSNSNVFLLEYYGVSAQGGQLEDQEKLLEINDPCDRIMVVDNDGNLLNDITLPLNRIVSKSNEKK